MAVDDPGLAASYAVWFRLVERAGLSLVVVLVALVASVAFWRSLQRIDFQLSRDKLSGGGTVVLATPLFALLALIGFAWVSFSNPVSVTVPSAAAAPAPPPGETGAPAVAAAGPVSFIGATGASAPPQGNLEFRRNSARELVSSLNCVAQAAGTVSARELDALARLRLSVMEPVWDAAWGDFAAFRDWAEGRSKVEPNPRARAFFEQVFSVC